MVVHAAVQLLIQLLNQQGLFALLLLRIGAREVKMNHATMFCSSSASTHLLPNKASSRQDSAGSWAMIAQFEQETEG